MAFTTAARGALALSTLPLWTMAVAALLGAEPLTARKRSASDRGRRGRQSRCWRGSRPRRRARGAAI